MSTYRRLTGASIGDTTGVALSALVQIKPAPSPGSCGFSDDHFSLVCQIIFPVSASRAKTSFDAPARMARVRAPSAVFTPETINGSRNDCIPIVLLSTFVFHSSCSLLTFFVVIFDSPRCQASRAGSALLVIHSAVDWLYAGHSVTSAHPTRQIARKTLKPRVLFKPLWKDMKLTPSGRRLRSLKSGKWLPLADRLKREWRLPGTAL